MTKNNLMSKIATVAVCGTLLCVPLAGCNGSSSSSSSSSSSQDQSQTSSSSSDSSSSEAAAFDAQAALDDLLADNPISSNYLVLSGIGDGWAPTVMVLDKDGGFTCVVNYAGQSTVAFASGTYTVNADGSITAEGSQYDTGDALTYEIAKDGDAYKTTCTIPSTETVVELTGTAA